MFFDGKKFVLKKVLSLLFIVILILILLCLSACPSSFFKPTQGDEACLQCPINSRTTSEGAINCVCRNGYYRTDSDPFQMPCTSTYAANVVMCKLAHKHTYLHTHEYVLAKSLVSNMNSLTHTHFTPASRRAPGSKDSGSLCNSKQRNPVRAVPHTNMTLTCP